MLMLMLMLMTHLIIQSLTCLFIFTVLKYIEYKPFKVTSKEFCTPRIEGAGV